MRYKNLEWSYAEAARMKAHSSIEDLQTVLDAHSDTIDVLHVLRPVGVCMAGANEFDPYKD